jgi:hypothetical protein
MIDHIFQTFARVHKLSLIKPVLLKKRQWSFRRFICVLLLNV